VTLKEARGAYDYFSGKLSEIVRQLSFAGIAVVWMFKSESGGVPFDVALLMPLRFFVVSLALDLAHYGYGSLAWGRFAHVQEKQGVTDDHNVDPPDHINWPSIAFFWLKSVSCALGYLILIIRLWDQIS